MTTKKMADQQDSAPVFQQIPPSLAAIANGRDHITTREFAHGISRAAQTIRKLLCQNGAVFGVRPVKFGGRLLWPVADIAALFSEGG